MADDHSPADHQADDHDHRPVVDYDVEIAHRYHVGRALSEPSMTRWRAAVQARLPDGELRRVVDVGAGTGVFLAMWRDLGAGQVIAVEPAGAMRAHAGAHADDGATFVVAGSAQRLPLAPASADVVWLSAVVHHVPDLPLAARELRRVLRPGGRVLVREFCPGTSVLPWLDHLPGADRGRARFPTVDELAEVLGSAGLTLLDVVNVTEPHHATGTEAADWITAMRGADSILTALADEEIATGVAALRALGETALPPVALTLVTAGRGPA